MLQNFNSAIKPIHYYLDEAEKAKNDRDFGFARKLLRDGTERHPNSARLWQELGKALRANPKWDDETLRCFAKAYELNPQSRHIAMEYAGFLGRKNQYAKGEEILMTMLAGEGENSRLLCALGHHFQLQKKYPLAIACFARACTLEPDGNISQRRYDEVVGLIGRPDNQDDQKKLSFRIIQMTARFQSAKPAEPAASA